MNSLSTKVAVVTGASKGIGSGIAERLAAEGARVVVNYASSAESADAVVGKIRAAGGEAVAVQADVSQPEAITRLFEAVSKMFGTLDILVNNAGIYEFGMLDAITPEQIDRQFALNVKGLILCTQAAVRLFPETGGVVVNISSVTADAPMVTAPLGCASKGAVNVLTRSFALELGPRNIRVVGIAPGLTETAATKGLPEEIAQPMISRTPLGRIGKPQDIAGVVAFAASDDGAWITGETIEVSGGLRL